MQEIINNLNRIYKSKQLNIYFIKFILIILMKINKNLKNFMSP